MPSRVTPTVLFLLLALSGGHDHSAPHAFWPHWDLWAIVEAAHDLAFRALLGLIGRQVQTRQDKRVIEHTVLFASGHKSEASEVYQHGSRAILSKDMQQRRPWRKMG